MDAVENELKTQLSTIQQQYQQCKTSLTTTRATLQQQAEKHATMQQQWERDQLVSTPSPPSPPLKDVTLL